MATVDIYLPIQATHEWIHILTIPHADIKRLTLRPLKWLRFTVFTVCGAKGHLSTTPGGDIADYENVSLDDLEIAYHYSPDGTYHFVDYKAMDDRDTDIISTSSVSSREGFHEAVQNRDHGCVFTGDKGATAAHIIPASKGDAYITFAVRDRFELYERLPFSRDGNVDIDVVENGMMLRQDLHSKFGKARIAFLKTPNFAMGTTDVESFEQQSSTSDRTRTTLQWMVNPATLRGTRGPVLQWDALPDWRHQVHSPPSILLDYVYGAAVVKHWKTDHLQDMLEKQFERTFSNLSAEEQKASNSNGKGPLPKGKQNRRKESSRDASEGLLEAMDSVLVLSMILKGIAPQTLVTQRKKQMEEAEQRSREHSCEKVQQWLGDSDASASHGVAWVVDE